MEELIHSVTHRPYVFVFLIAFLALSWLEQGRLRMLIWLITGCLIAFVAEWASINPEIRLPFGYYIYHGDELARDLTIAGVPFFDSLSFAFLSYVSFSFAQFFMSPLWRKGLDFQRVAPRGIRNSPATLFLGASLMVVIDLVTDPVAHLGQHWFLGSIYHYPEPGHHYGIPLANYAGWFVVGLAIIFVNQRADALLARREAARGSEIVLPYVPASAALAPLFWAGIVGFSLGVTMWLGWGYDLELVPEGEHEVWLARLRNMFLSGCFIVGPILLLAWVQFVKPANRPSAEELAAWLAEFPRPDLKERISAR